MNCNDRVVKRLSLFREDAIYFKIRAACGIDRPALHAVAPEAAERGAGCPAHGCTATTTTCPNSTHIKSKISEVHFFFLNAL